MTSLAGLLLALAVAWPLHLSAQSEATLSGSVTDESKAVLPGVTITATEVSSGRQYLSVTDERGEYRLPSMLPGAYRVQAELPGFSTVVIPRVELLVGRNASLPMTLRVAAVQETLTVTGESPLIDLKSVEVGSNIDRRQMEELPIQGRNWMELSMLVKGVTANDVSGGRPGAAREDMFQLNLDGQQITQQVAGSGFGQPGLSREAIAEYQVLTNQYDITMGRSVGMQVQAVSRAGTNLTAGSVYGYFRDDKWNAKDFVADRVLPYSNQQTGFSLGGPILRDRVHYFGTYEYEREPQTILSSPQLSGGQTFSLPTTVAKHNLLGRADFQFGPRDHLVARFNYSNFRNPFAQVGGGDHPTAASEQKRDAAIATANWSRVLSNTAVQEIRAGFYQYHWENSLAEGVPDTPQYILGGLNVGGRFNYPQWFQQTMPSARYDLNLHRGGHDLKIGGEYLHRADTGWWPLNRRGQFTFNTMPADVLATFGSRFPLDAWNDASRWDLSGLDQYVNRYGTTFSRSDDIDIPRKTWAIWAGDTWSVNERLTVNAGVRWDVDWGAMSPPGPGGEGEFQDIVLPITNGFDPAGYDVGWKNGIRDLKNISPRVGATFKLDDTLVLRGGAGVFYSSQVSNLAFSNQLNNGQNVASVQIVNDGLPGFLQDPLRGRTADDYLSGRVPLPPQGLATIAHDYKGPRTYQVNVGFQKQIGAVFGVDSDLVYAKGKHLGLQRDINIFYDAATGYPLNPTPSPGVNRRPLPQFGSITIYDSKLESESLALASSLTRRFRDRWQAGVTYTLMFFSNDHGTGTSGWLSLINNPFCIDCEWGRSADFQRHTLRINGVYQAPWGINAAGIFSYGSGNYFSTTIAGNPFGLVGAVSSINRVNTGGTVTIPETTTLNGKTLEVRDRFDGPTTIAPGEHVPRNALRGFPLSKVDIRLSKDVIVPGSHVKLTGTFEVFNLFNHANYGSYNAIVGNPAFGRPVQNINLSYLPRVVQLAFRVGF